ncbi:UDP-GlcNAc:betaGal beta-1,3-N-acetylglucosaminyltransferase-like protein 1 isoform X2 [Trichosurus vulpecula]|uniref:UDP-GlcNAc:betaGal beta-1,3-N-acetylglucosaminyltransferase-like protein 1 isoform X2 n=1 Tax=Trichosurus vulpecula TaxID=9337 RepID=UPI00186AFE3D|nr:UDP-GlcNAc:betaGal beta-1,3-N-acetylglucosaminyltransferase-like protein 1 isoform X2 [Trichosurus vulpecula]
MWNSDRAIAAPDTLRPEVSGADRAHAVADQLLPSPSLSSTSAQPVPHLTVQSPGSGPKIQVSIILPVHNAECWLDDCLQSVSEQDFEGTLELSIFNDASKDKSMNIINKWKIRLETLGIRVIIGGHDSPSPRGVGFSKNQAIAQSSGSYLCFLDSIIGCQVKREPPNSTERYTRWINNLTSKQLITQVFTSYGPTVIMPTWFCSQEWFSQVGKFDESGKGVPEDLLFFYHHLRKGGGVFLVEQCLLLYRYHPYAATHSVLESTIWQHRVQFLEERVLQHWTTFTIWNAGKQGRKLYRSLSPVNQKKVVAFCDVDENKIKKGFYSYEDSKEKPKPKIPIRHFKDADPPFVICVKLDLTGGTFEENLESLNLQEGLDYLHFS